MSSVDLGFLEKCEAWLLTNKFFPSKVGGRPAWLELQNLPNVKDLKCEHCQNELIFLCQIYAPLDEYEGCFHRTLYIFICTNSSCWEPNKARNILVLRSQLPRVNTFFASEPESEEVQSEEIPSSVKLCAVCGCRGPLSCSKCGAVSYCGSAHQKIDWTLGDHKKNCGQIDNKSSLGNPKHKHLFDEYELVIEPEELDVESANDDDEEAEKQRQKEYEEFLEKQKNEKTDVDLNDVPDEEFQKYTDSAEEDVIFSDFKKRIQKYQDQVIRFNRRHCPLWISQNNQLDLNDVPSCENCQSKRVFEFQIMPQLLNSLKNESLDWGVLNVYTCEKSCDTNSKYVKEFVYKQDIVNETPNK